MLIGTTTLDQNRPGINGKEGLLHIVPDLRNWSLTIKCSFVLYQRQYGLLDGRFNTYCDNLPTLKLLRKHNKMRSITFGVTLIRKKIQSFLVFGFYVKDFYTLCTIILYQQNNKLDCGTSNKSFRFLYTFCCFSCYFHYFFLYICLVNICTMQIILIGFYSVQNPVCNS